MLKIILPISISLFFLMFAYNSVESILPLKTYGTDIYEYVTLCLSIVYLTLTLFNIISGYLVSIKPAGSLIIFGPIGYFLFSFSFLYQNIYFWIVSSIILGITASIYWISLKALIFREIERKHWGKAFGLTTLITLLGSGLGPFILFKKYSLLNTILEISLILSLFSILPLIFLKNKGRDMKNRHGITFHILSEKKLLLYSLAAYSLSVYLPFIIIVIPYISSSEKILGEYRLISYSLPGMLSLLGGIIYDKYKKIIPVFLIIATLSIMLINYNLLFLGFILTSSISLASPGIQALLGEIVPKKYLGATLGFIGFLSGIGVSLNIYIFAYILSNLNLIHALVYAALNLFLASILISYILRKI